MEYLKIYGAHCPKKTLVRQVMNLGCTLQLEHHFKLVCMLAPYA